MGAVRATINGEEILLAERTPLVAFLAGRDVDVRRIAVERNRVVVPRAAHHDVVIEDGDVYEVVHFVGGG